MNVFLPPDVLKTWHFNGLTLCKADVSEWLWKHRTLCDYAKCVFSLNISVGTMTPAITYGYHLRNSESPVPQAICVSCAAVHWLAVAVLSFLGRIFRPVRQITSAAKEKNTPSCNFFCFLMSFGPHKKIILCLCVWKSSKFLRFAHP
jgi:hypothetical protein